MPYRRHFARASTRTRLVFVKAVLAAFLFVTACGDVRPLLNSERIEQKFGSYGVDIIASDRTRRLSSLYSLTDGERVCRTYATVRFMQPVDRLLAAEHARVVGGQSIGTVFKSAGWTITKPHSWFGETALTASDIDILRRMRIELPQKLATHRYVFRVEKSGRWFDYAVITEMHHPAYLTLRELRSIYGDESVAARIVNAH